jgi:predicted nucleotide-binding protein (sugar kinase/HSP70/actin superfamily)
MSEIAERLKGRQLFIPRMGEGSVQAFVAAFESAGIEACLVPPSDQRTLELSASHFSGDECYPARVVFGDFLKVIESEGPERVALLLPTTSGPCRFGCYAPYLRQVLKKLGCGQVPVVSPSCANAYEGIETIADGLIRTGWRAIVASDILHRALLSVRPYERNAGESDAVYLECLRDLCRVLSRRGTSARKKLRMLAASLEKSRERFRSIPLTEKELPVIGVVGEIFCRLNEFSNQDIIRRIESHGAECRLSGVPEWLAYIDRLHRKNMRAEGKHFSLSLAKEWVRSLVQRRDERALFEPFRGVLEEEPGVDEILELSEPYLPSRGVLGEMVLSVGKAIYLCGSGASGVVDISPFSCMNGIVCQAVYPRVSSDHHGFPIRVFFFDQSPKDLDQDIAIFLDRVHTYRKQNPDGS